MLKQRLTFLSLLFVFLSPLYFAWQAYQSPQQWHLSPKNHGTLIAPGTSFNSLPVSYSVNSQPSASIPWRVIYVTQKTCQASCLNNLAKMEKVREALGRNESRIQLAFISSQPQALPTPPQNFLSGTVSSADLNTFLQATETPPPLRNAAWYIVDPNQNVVLRYRADVPQKEIYEDLTRLLQVENL